MVAAWAAFVIRTFVFQFGLLLLVIACVAAWKKQKRMALATLPLLVVTVGPAVLQYLPVASPAVSGESVTVMSVNLLMINKTTEPIISEIKAADPDILLLQEYTPDWHEALTAAIASEYAHIREIQREDSFGAAIYSKRPFNGHVNTYLPLGRATEPQIRGVVEIDGREVAVYNIHFLPPWGLDYVIETRCQFADLRDRLEAEELPVILCGDFNFTERSLQASSLRRAGILEAQDLGGRGRGTTWPVSSFFRWIPSVRLDHIYISNHLTCTDCRTGTGRGSDHRPVIARIGFAEGPAQ
ncbi:endonuclease/exonuclease/phosphatase family protein [bacterium]|nr:endonuclease/exonuclease/phosphatase family protein [bacterium]